MRIFFSAHGVPLAYVEEAGDPYKAEMEECIDLIMEELEKRKLTNPYTLAYQVVTLCFMLLYLYLDQFVPTEYVEFLVDSFEAISWVTNTGHIISEIIDGRTLNNNAMLATFHMQDEQIYIIIIDFKVSITQSIYMIPLYDSSLYHSKEKVYRLTIIFINKAYVFRYHLCFSIPSFSLELYEFHIFLIKLYLYYNLIFWETFELLN